MVKFLLKLELWKFEGQFDLEDQGQGHQISKYLFETKIRKPVKNLKMINE